MRTLTTLVAALGLSTAAFGQELPPFEDVDQNGDGMISEAEASVVEGLDFTAADADQNGAISPEEYSSLL